AKSVVTADHVSRGRVELGIGAGWLEAEHRAYGFPFYDMKTRLELLADQMEIIRGQWSDGPVSFNGHYQLVDLHARPQPVHPPRPPLIPGGSGGPRSLALAARFADEYNTIFSTPDEMRALRERLDPGLRLSLMTPFVLGGERSRLDVPAAAVAGTA